MVARLGRPVLERRRPPPRGSRHTNPALADTYQRIVEESERAARTREDRIDAARRIWREGFVAEEILASLARPVPDGSGGQHRGLLCGGDLAAWRANYEEPVSLTYADHTVHKTGPWGQGPVFLQQLRLAEALGIGDLDTFSAEFAHRVTEAAKLAFADREAWYGDPVFVDVPLTELLGEAYAEQRAALVDGGVSTELRPGSPDGDRPFVPGPYLAGETPLDRLSGEPTASRGVGQRGDTCHLDIVDAAGNMVSATPSGGWLHTSPVIESLGFPLGTRGQMFWLDPRSPSVVAPGKRPRTTLSPTLVTRGGEAVLALGTPGGDQQDQWTFTCFLRIMHAGMNLQEAIDAPMFHGNSFPSSFYPREMAPGELVVEPRLGVQAMVDLERRGHRVVVADDWSLGRLAAVARDPATGELRAGADPRACQGYAAGR